MFASSLASQPYLIAAAIIAVYIVLGMLYESFIHPIVYSRATEAEAMQAKTLTEDEARRVAVNIAKLPELLRG